MLNVSLSFFLLYQLNYFGCYSEVVIHVGDMERAMIAEFEQCAMAEMVSFCVRNMCVKEGTVRPDGSSS